MATINLILSDPAAPAREAIVTVMGEVDVEDRESLANAIRLVLPHAPLVVVDLSEVTAFAATILEELLVAQDVCSAAAATLVLRSPSDHVLRAIEVTEMAARFRIEHPVARNAGLMSPRAKRWPHYPA